MTRRGAELEAPPHVGPGGAWGLSTSVDLWGCAPETIRSRERIREYVVELCALIDMRR